MHTKISFRRRWGPCRARLGAGWRISFVVGAAPAQRQQWGGGGGAVPGDGARRGPVRPAADGAPPAHRQRAANIKRTVKHQSSTTNIEVFRLQLQRTRADSPLPTRAAS